MARKRGSYGTCDRGQRIKSDEQIKEELKKCAKKYAPYLDKYLLFIYIQDTKIKGNKKLMHFESFFGKERYMHLVGYTRKKDPYNNERYLNNKNAKDFYDECYFDSSIDLSQYKTTESKKTTSAKLDVVKNMLNFHYFNIYAAGKKDLITENVNFKIGIGNNQGVLGFNLFKAKFHYYYSPMTSLKNDIKQYISKPGKVLCILAKEKENDLYSHIVGAPAIGVEISVLRDYPMIIELIHPTLLNLPSLKKSNITELTENVVREKK